MINLKRVLIAAATAGFLALPAAAMAMPVGQLGADARAAAAASENGVQQVRWVCGRGGRCVWRPNYRVYRPYRPYRYYGYGYYPRPYYGPRYYRRW